MLDSRQSQNIRCKAYSEFTLCQVSLYNEEVKKDVTPDTLRPIRVQVLKKLNTLLELLHRTYQTNNAKFLIPLIEQNSMMIWNIGLHFIHVSFSKLSH